MFFDMNFTNYDEFGGLLIQSRKLAQVGLGFLPNLPCCSSFGSTSCKLPHPTNQTKCRAPNVPNMIKVMGRIQVFAPQTNWLLQLGSSFLNRGGDKADGLVNGLIGQIMVELVNPTAINTG